MYPRMVYQSASVHKAVNNDTERAAALQAGWYDSVPEAVAKAHAPLAPAPKPFVNPAAKAAEDAASKKSAEIAGIMADLKTKDAAAQKEYALALGLEIPKKADSEQILISIEKALNAA